MICITTFCVLQKLGNERRLISGLNDKIGYWVHYRLLETYLRLGLKLRRINDIIFFKEKSFIKKYIKKNTKLRQKSLSTIKKDIYKLKNNSVYAFLNFRMSCLNTFLTFSFEISSQNLLHFHEQLISTTF